MFSNKTKGSAKFFICYFKSYGYDINLKGQGINIVSCSV